MKNKTEQAFFFCKLLLIMSSKQLCVLGLYHQAQQALLAASSICAPRSGRALPLRQELLQVGLHKGMALLCDVAACLGLHEVLEHCEGAASQQA